jgi:hypothetical protein
MSSGEAAGARLGEGSRAPRVVGLLAEHCDLEVAARRAAAVHMEATGERISAIGRGTSG